MTLPSSAQYRQGQACIAQLCQQGEAKSPAHLLCRQGPDKAHLFTLAQHQLSRWLLFPHPTHAALAVHTNLPSSVCSSQVCRCSRHEQSSTTVCHNHSCRRSSVGAAMLQSYTKLKPPAVHRGCRLITGGMELPPRPHFAYGLFLPQQFSSHIKPGVSFI